MRVRDCVTDSGPADFKEMPSRRRGGGLTVDHQHLQLRERCHGRSRYHIRFMFASELSLSVTGVAALACGTPAFVLRPSQSTSRYLGPSNVVMRSLKFAFRTLFRTPFVTAVAIVSLALGIGATAGIFSVFHQVLLQSLAVPHPSELVNLSAPGPKPGFGSCGREGDCEAVFSYAMFRDLQNIQTVFTGIAAHVSFGANLGYDAQTSSGEGLLVSGSYFPVLGMQPALGRLLDPSDDKLVGESRAAVLSYLYWSSRFGLDP